MDLVGLIRAKLSLLTTEPRNVLEGVRAAITSARRAETSPEQLRMPLDKLLAVLAGEG